MAFEIRVIEQWIYTTLKADATLASLLAVDNLPSNYQQGIYHMVAPQIDVVSRKEPKYPFVVFSNDGMAEDETALCGSRVFSRPDFRITVWDSSSGSVSTKRAEQIMDRIDTLIDNQRVNSTTPRFYIRRSSSGNSFMLSDGGRTDVGVTAMYSAVTQS